MIIIGLAILVCVAGLVIFVTAKTNADVKEIGRLMFFAGLLAMLLVGFGPIVAEIGRH